MPKGRLIVVCGLAAEAKIAVGRESDDTVTVFAGGGDQERLAAEIEAAAVGAAGILSFGVAGGLAPSLRSGDTRVADLVIAPDGELFTPHPGWAAALRLRLASNTSGRLMVKAKLASNRQALAAIQPPGTHAVRDAAWSPQHEENKVAAGPTAIARFACVDTPLADCAGKAALHRATGADLVDMESHIAARSAARHGVPFAALRAVTDPAHRSLPHAATVGMRSDGTVDLAAIFQSLKRDPSQVPALIRTGLDARAAFASLFRSRQVLGARFALLDF